MRIYLLTGGIGAGKSTLGKVLNAQIMAQADAVRERLGYVYRDVDWFRRDQAYKDAPHPFLNGKTPRDVLISECDRLVREKGMGVLAHLALERVRKEVGRNVSHARPNTGAYLIDDIRRVEEVEVFREAELDLDYRVTHFHIEGGVQDTQETAANMADLRALANYVVERGGRIISG